MPHQLVVMRIAQDQSILVVVERKAFRDGFNRFQETLSGERYLLFAEFEVSNVAAGAAVASEIAISPKNRFAADLQIALNHPPSQCCTRNFETGGARRVRNNAFSNEARRVRGRQIPGESCRAPAQA